MRCHALLFGFVRGEVVVLVDGLHVLVAVDRLGIDVRHADLLSLIDDGRALLEEIRRRERLSALGVVLFAAVAADDAGMVVVFNIQKIPALPVQCLLPVLPDGLELHKAERVMGIVLQEAVALHALERDHHVKLRVLAAEKSSARFVVMSGGLADGHASRNRRARCGTR